jgi:hypothetical protein
MLLVVVADSETPDEDYVVSTTGVPAGIAVPAGVSHSFGR